MEAVAELTAEEQKAIETFKPPMVRVGQSVAFYPMGNVGKKYDVGVVARVWGRLVDIVIFGRGMHTFKSSVRHVDDPKLALNESQRENGSWDFTEFEKHERQERIAINKRLTNLEQALVHCSIAGDRNVLMNRAKTLGLKGYTKAKNADIRKAIMQREESIAEGTAGWTDDELLIQEVAHDEVVDEAVENLPPKPGEDE